MNDNDNSNVVAFTGVTSLDIRPDGILQAAVGNLTECTIVGFDKDGEFYFASTQADGGDVLWHLEKARFALMKITDPD